MSVFLTVLKIIGWILLCILLLILTLIFIVLFVPVRYKVIIDKDNPDADFKAFGNVSFLLHIISAKAFYDNDFDYYVKVFGIKVKKKKQEIESSGSEPSDTNASYNNPENESTHTSEHVLSESEEALTTDAYTIDWNEEPSSTDNNEDESNENESIENKSIENKFSLFIEKLGDKYDGLRRKLLNIKSGYERTSKLINDSHNKNAVSYICATAQKLIKHYLPRKAKGFVHFGFDDPATTGKVLMYLGILYPILPQHLKIDPDFEDTDIYGNLFIKGHIRIIHLALAGIRLLISKDVRRLWKLYKQTN